uniref:Uncharacterized protein n=1 Tax=Tetranychus urticae TaxID=32264 RepID=T1K615_TETUR
MSKKRQQRREENELMDAELRQDKTSQDKLFKPKDNYLIRLKWLAEELKSSAKQSNG